MIIQERLTNYPRHPSIRGEFGFELYKAMVSNPNIFLLMGDLGYALFDPHREDFPERCINVGAAEQCLLGVAVGLAMEGKTVVTYTISSFYLRAAETIGLYLDGEQIPVKMVGSGRDGDYAHDGPSHNGTRAQNYLSSLNICQLYPDTKEEVPGMVQQMLSNNRPTFMSLKR